MYDLMIYDFGNSGQEDVSFGNKASIVESRTAGRIQPLHFGVNYHESPLEFKFVFGSERALDRYELEMVSMWLTGHQDYKWLAFDQPDMERVLFRCIITELTPLSHGWLPVAFEATVVCDCPYAYSYPFSEVYKIDGETEVLFRNESTVREYLKPVITIVPSPGVTQVQIINKSDNGRAFILSDLPSSGPMVIVDNNNGIITDVNSEYNLYSGFNMNFFRLVPGDNELVITGDGMISVSGRFLYNVAG